MSANALSKALRVTALRINAIVRECCGITPDTTMRLARYFGGNAQWWPNLHSSYRLCKTEIDNAQRIEIEIQPAAKACADGAQRRLPW